MEPIVNSSLSANCLQCNGLILCMTYSELGSMIFFGKCKNSNCTTSKQKCTYVCKWCYDYSSINPAPGRTGGGRKVGIYSSLKAVKRHFKSSTHINSSAQNSHSCEVTSVDENNSFNDEIEWSDILTKEPTEHNDSSTIQRTSYDFFNDCGFDSQSKSPAFYAFVKDNEGKGAHYLTAKAFSVDVEAVSFEEARFSLLMANLLCQQTKTQQKLLSEILILATNANDEK